MQLRYDILLYKEVKLLFPFKTQNMLQNRRSNSGSLLLAGLAAFAYYKYSKMTPEERRNLFESLKAKGKKLVDDYVPAEIKDVFMKQGNATAPANSHFGEGSDYTG